MVFLQEESDLENGRGRIARNGQGAETVRRAELRELQARIAAFMAHGGLADIIALRTARRYWESTSKDDGRAALVEAFGWLRDTDSEPQRDPRRWK
jgi:hypothetical protein